MSYQYIGEIRIFNGHRPPAGWAFCDGSLFSIAENKELFQLIGTTYGGDGEINFAIPDFNGRVIVHNGLNPLTGRRYQLGEKASSVMKTLPENTLSLHTCGLSSEKKDIYRNAYHPLKYMIKVSHLNSVNKMVKEVC